MLKAFEFVDGLRGSKQVLFESNLFNKHNGNQWRCRQCSSLLTIDEQTKQVTKEPPSHSGHQDLTAVQLAVFQSYEKMKKEAKLDQDIMKKTIYDKNLKSLIDQGFALSDISQHIMPFTSFRGTLTKIRATLVPLLPTESDDIDFNSPKYEQYTVTNEKKLFLRYI